MAQFTADIAGMLELFAVAAGLVLLHWAGKTAPAKLLKAAFHRVRRARTHHARYAGLFRIVVA